MDRNKFFAQVFSRKLKEWCNTNGLNQADFSQRIGVHLNMISRYKSGKAYPTEEIMDRLCSVLGCSKEDLVPDVGMIKPEKTLADFSTKELLAEIERRCRK